MLSKVEGQAGKLRAFQSIKSTYGDTCTRVNMRNGTYLENKKMCLCEISIKYIHIYMWGCKWKRARQQIHKHRYREAIKIT